MENRKPKGAQPERGLTREANDGAAWAARVNSNVLIGPAMRIRPPPFSTHFFSVADDSSLSRAQSGSMATIVS